MRTLAIQVDFSPVNVFLVASVPDSHRGGEINLWGHRRLAHLLRKHLRPEDLDGSDRVIAQCSSIGSLGPDENSWLRGEFGRALEGHSGQVGGARPRMSVVYPSKGDVMSSYDAILGGGCLPYSMNTHKKQPWLERHLHRWRSDSMNRSRAMPHIKTYARIDENQSRAAYFLLTSANLSKAAWGSLNKAGNGLQIQSYEAGVLFLPEFVLGRDRRSFELGKDLNLPYDLPLQKYSSGDSVWFMDYLKAALNN